MTDVDPAALARLRHEALSVSPAYPGGPAALAFHTEMMARVLPAALEGPTGGLFQDSDEVGLNAFVLWWREPFLPGGPEVTHLLAVRRPGSDPAWLLRALDEVLPGLDDTVNATLLAWDAAARAHLLGRGLGMSSVHLAGRVDEALQRLVEARDPPRQPGGGLTLAVFEEHHLDDVMDIRREYFSKHLGFCWFGADPGALAEQRRRVLARGPRDLHLAVLEGQTVRGYASAAVRDPCPHHGSSAGMDLVLHPEIQGRGVGTVAYRVLLEHLAAEGVGWVKGTTGQPPVMRLARLMGRRPMGVDLRRSPVLPTAWFDAILREPQAAINP